MWCAGEMAKASGCDGVIAAPTDVAAVRRACGRRFLIITPGVHLSGGPKAPDQARVATAADSIRAGADKVVVGRAVYAALSPARAFDQLAWEVAAALR
jgi:orotidine-5'-phosphate decarboxylase